TGKSTGTRLTGLRGSRTTFSIPSARPERHAPRCLESQGSGEVLPRRAASKGAKGRETVEDASIRGRLRAVAVTGGLIVLTGVLLAMVGVARAGYAPLNQPGPKLEVSGRLLRPAVRCTPEVASDPREPILLIPGTTLTPEANFSWNYEKLAS